MDILEIIGLIGSLVSIGGAIWASMSVGIIKKTKNEIFSRLRIVKYSELTSSSKGTVTQLRKIANKDKIPPGINFQEITDSLNDYYENLNKIKNDIKEDGFSDLEKYMNDMKDNINTATSLDRKNPKAIIEIYTKMYYHILEIDSEISKYNKKIIEK
jgi:hypothetical protein